MRKVYMVVYDYKGSASKYNGLFEELKKFPGWWHYIDRAWLVVSEVDENSIYEKLKPHLDSDIHIFIIGVTKDRQGWLPKKAWKWISENLDKYA